MPFCWCHKSNRFLIFFLPPLLLVLGRENTFIASGKICLICKLLISDWHFTQLVRYTKIKVIPVHVYKKQWWIYDRVIKSWIKELKVLKYKKNYQKREGVQIPSLTIVLISPILCTQHDYNVSDERCGMTMFWYSITMLSWHSLNLFSYIYFDIAFIWDNECL
jgi:hypothetical protein